MRRYLAFYGSVYYPSGGMDDFIGDFDSKEEAIKEIIERINYEDYPEDIEYKWKYNWSHIYDTELRSEVWSK